MGTSEQPLNLSIDVLPEQYVGFWWRVLASLIDTILTSFLLIPLLSFFVAGPLGLTSTGLIIQTILPAIAIMIFWLTKSATPGKMAIGAVVVDARHGGKLNKTQCLIRYLAYYLSAIPLMLGFIWVVFDERKQGWHDKLANTVVIFKQPRSGDSLTS